MNLININLYGEGYYSGSTYEETIYLLEDDYKSLNKDFVGEEIDLGELDGKHSEVYGEVEVEVISDEEQGNYNFEVKNDGENLYYELSGYTDDIEEMIKRADKYIDGLDSIVDVSYAIKKSKVKELNEFVSKLR